MASTTVASSLILSSCAATKLKIEPNMDKIPKTNRTELRSPGAEPRASKGPKMGSIELRHVISKEQAQIIRDYGRDIARPPIRMDGTLIPSVWIASSEKYSDLSIERVEGDDTPQFRFKDYGVEDDYELQVPSGERADVIRLKLKSPIYYKDTDKIISQLKMMMPQKRIVYFRIPECRNGVQTSFINEILLVVFR